MTGYNGFDIRSTVFAVICSLVFSTTFVASAIGPGVAASAKANPSTTIVMPLA